MPPTKKTTKTQSPRAGNPSLVDMIKECIIHAGVPHRGISPTQIKKYVGKVYSIQVGSSQLSKAITSGEQNGIFILPKGPHGKVELAVKSRSTGASTNEELSHPFEFKFRKGRGAFDLSNAKGFISLLEDIRMHLLRSQSTRAVYVEMAKKFFLRLAKDIKAICTEPTDDHFLSYIRSHWPTFKSSKDLQQEHSLTWGQVLKHEARKKNEIHILSMLVEAGEHAHDVIVRCLPTELYHLIITVVVLHELAHAFTKFHFHDNLTPIGVRDGDQQDCGESGWLIEQIMGGHLCVEWADAQHFGDMLHIDHVLLMKSGKYWELDANVAKTSLSSLQRVKFVQPAQEKLRKHAHPRGSVRARVTESTDQPRAVSIGPHSGLGITFGSFIGGDRK